MHAHELDPAVGNGAEEAQHLAHLRKEKELGRGEAGAAPELRQAAHDKVGPYGDPRRRRRAGLRGGFRGGGRWRSPCERGHAAARKRLSSRDTPAASEIFRSRHGTSASART